MKQNIFNIFYNSYKNNPHHPCIIFDDRKYSYNEVYEKSCKISKILKRTNSVNIGILSHRSLQTYYGILGILKANRSYVPISFKNSSKMVKNIIESSDIQFLLIDYRFLDFFIESVSGIQRTLTIFIPNKVKADVEKNEKQKKIKFVFEDEFDLFIKNHKTQYPLKNDNAYIMFTSGSTGVPKGVQIKHSQVIAYVNNINSIINFEPIDRFSQTFDISFDLSVHDLFVCWSNGAQLCIPSKSIINSIKYIKNNKITVWFSVPSFAQVIINSIQGKSLEFSELRISLFCGEPLHQSLVNSWKQHSRNSEIFNLYGPTEATIAISVYKCRFDNKISALVPIGKIFSDQKYMVDLGITSHDQEGELCLSGSQVITSYYNKLEDNRITFFIVDGKTYYRTGDIVYEKNGCLHFARRIDDQIKLNGYRIELEEINTYIKELTLASKVLSIVWKNKILSFVFDKKSDISDNKIFKAISLNIPSYAIPYRIINLQLKDTPVNTNGKIDKQKLLSNYA